MNQRDPSRTVRLQGAEIQNVEDFKYLESIVQSNGESGREVRWFGHVQRRDSDYIGRRMMRLELPGRKPRRRPKRRFMDAVKEDMQSVGVREEDAEEEDGIRFRRMICSGDP